MSDLQELIIDFNFTENYDDGDEDEDEEIGQSL